MPPEKSDARGDEVLLLVFGAEEPLVDFGEKTLDPHDQEEELEHPDSPQALAERGQKIQHQEYGETEPYAAAKGPSLEPLEGGVLEGTPKGGVKAGQEGNRYTGKKSQRSRRSLELKSCLRNRPLSP